MGDNILLPSTVISGSIAQPGKTRVSWAVNTLPTLLMYSKHCVTNGCTLQTVDSAVFVMFIVGTSFAASSVSTAGVR